MIERFDRCADLQLRTRIFYARVREGENMAERLLLLKAMIEVSKCAYFPKELVTFLLSVTWHCSAPLYRDLRVYRPFKLSAPISYGLFTNNLKAVFDSVTFLDESCHGWIDLGRMTISVTTYKSGLLKVSTGRRTVIEWDALMMCLLPDLDLQCIRRKFGGDDYARLCYLYKDY